MRVLAVCESPPTLDPVAGNGSTLIPAQVLPRLSGDIEVDLVWFTDRTAAPSPDVLSRCRSHVAMPLRSGRSALLGQPFTRLPRAGWQRADPAGVVRRLAQRADVVYLHGLHVFPLARGLHAPVVAHEVDPWSHYWRERAASGGGARALYDRVQARRAAALERQVGAQARHYVVVNSADARALGRELRRTVEALPNGVDLSRLPPRHPDQEESDLLVFVGTLDYPPNIAAVRELCERVLPRVQASRPRARVVLAGRRPAPEVQALARPGVEVLGAVDHVREVYARAAVAVYPGTLGRGTKNTVLEALAVGCPVVASPEAARAVQPGPYLALGRSADELAAHVVALLDDPDRRRASGAAAAELAARLPGWDAVAAEYERLLRTAAAS